MTETYPTLRERVRAVLLDAGFKAREDTLPTYSSGGTFDLTSGAGVRVSVAWWDSTPDQRRALLERFAVALEDAGMAVADQGDRLYVAEPALERQRRRGAEPSSASLFYRPSPPP